MYAIALTLNEQKSPKDAATKVDKFLQDRGFKKQFGLYLYDDQVFCILAAKVMSEEFPWLIEAAESIRLLAIRENSSLIPALTLARITHEDNEN
jgi:virulence-associated protein VapD